MNYTLSGDTIATLLREHGSTVQTYLAIVSGNRDESGQIILDLPRLSARTGLAQRSIYTSLARLEECNLIRRTTRTRTPAAISISLNCRDGEAVVEDSEVGDHLALPYGTGRDCDTERPPNADDSEGLSSPKPAQVMLPPQAESGAEDSNSSAACCNASASDGTEDCTTRQRGLGTSATVEARMRDCCRLRYRDLSGTESVRLHAFINEFFRGDKERFLEALSAIDCGVSPEAPLDLLLVAVETADRALHPVQSPLGYLERYRK